jgi:hypothetical protein
MKYQFRVRTLMGAVAVVTLCCLEPQGSVTAQSPMMVATVYDDGRSCPNDCDAHVVFNAKHNGTATAFATTSTRTKPAKCLVGRPCTICFAAEDASCMTAIYRGGGPAPGRFDFTPAFFEQTCPMPQLPKQFVAICRGAEPRVAQLSKLVNCIARPDHEKCKTVMIPAAGRKAADDVLYLECKKVGEPSFNKKHDANPAKQRSNDCAYERVPTAKNSTGQTWRRLLDGACRPGTYAGRDGLDCCSGSVMAAALLGPECRQFFVEPESRQLP